MGIGDLKEEGELMATKGPKTVRGWERKMMTGDGRKSTPTEKALKEMGKATKDLLSGKGNKTYLTDKGGKLGIYGRWGLTYDSKYSQIRRVCK